MPDQPWSDIRGMGNPLRRAYDRVDVDILWRTATNRVPDLKQPQRNRRWRNSNGDRADRISERCHRRAPQARSAASRCGAAIEAIGDIGERLPGEGREGLRRRPTADRKWTDQ